MYSVVAHWLDDILERELPDAVAAFSFNLYEDGGNRWSMELVGTDRFDPEDEDWRCDEVSDLGTREQPLSWTRKAGWDEILEEMVRVLKRYLEEGAHAAVLKRYQGIGVGFVDGDTEILYGGA